VAASLVGDTLLYTVLPVSAARLGISRPVVGVILSANRWVRLLTIGRASSRRSIRGKTSAPPSAHWAEAFSPRTAPRRRCSSARR